MDAICQFIKEACDDVQEAGLVLRKAEEMLAKGYTLNRLESKVAAMQRLDRAQRRLDRLTAEAGGR